MDSILKVLLHKLVLLLFISFFIQIKAKVKHFMHSTILLKINNKASIIKQQTAHFAFLSHTAYG